MNYKFLSFIYWPVSGVLWAWHHVFGFIFGFGSALGWALAIVFLVWSLRAVMLKPAIHSVRSMRKMQELQPQLKEIQKKYSNDKQRQGQELQKFQREHGVNPVGGCLPMLLQIPVFIGLYEVVLNFSATKGANYAIPPSGVASYLHANLFGDARLSEPLWGLSFFHGAAAIPQGFHPGVAVLAIPLMIIAAVSTHFTARLSAKRQQAMPTQPTQPGQPNMQGMMQKLSMWVFPLGVLAIGVAYPIGLLLYWLGNNSWTLAQQYFVFKRMDKEEEKKKEQQVETQRSLAPKPGQKPVRDGAAQGGSAPSLSKEAAAAPNGTPSNGQAARQKQGAQGKQGPQGRTPAQAKQEPPGRTAAQAKQGAQGKQAAAAKQRERAEARRRAAQNAGQNVPAHGNGGSGSGKPAGGQAGSRKKQPGSNSGGKPREQQASRNGSGTNGSKQPSGSAGRDGKAAAGRNDGSQARPREKAGKGAANGKQSRKS